MEEAINEKQVTQGALDITDPATGLKVIDTASLQAASDILVQIKGYRKKINDFFGPLVKTAHEAHKALTTKKKETEQPLVNAEAYLKWEIGSYVAEQERKAREEAERIRQEQIKAEEDARLLTIQQAKDAGEEELVQEITETEVYVPPPVVEKTTPKLNGVSISTRWKFEVVNLLELCQAIVDGNVPVQAIQANTVFIGQQARSLQKALNYPGVKVYPDTNVSARG